jgi:hypothetical protein
MDNQENAPAEVVGEDTAAVLSHASGDKTYLEPKAEPQAEPQPEEQPGEDDAAAKADTDAEAEAQPKPKKTAKERIDELTWRLREAERREAALLDRIGGKQAPAPEAHPPAHTGDGRPDPNAYESGVYDPRYLEDLTDWKAEQAVQRTLSQRQERETVQTKLSTFESKADELFPEGEPEGLQAFRSLPQVPQAIADVILASDIGPKLAEHLGDHPREFQRISALPAHMQARELTLLETRLTAPKEEPKPSPKITAAPEPPPQNRGAGGRFTVAPDTSDFAAFKKQYGIG